MAGNPMFGIIRPDHTVFLVVGAFVGSGECLPNGLVDSCPVFGVNPIDHGSIVEQIAFGTTPDFPATLVPKKLVGFKTVVPGT
jgi:hypothetical protein